ncbi:MAG: hypothetical protein IPN49_18515 [Saprospiraceae bacterium]|nr:hypothetical protein [Saprospiraceae bacterium]
MRSGCGNGARTGSIMVQSKIIVSQQLASPTWAIKVCRTVALGVHVDGFNSCGYYSD